MLNLNEVVNDSENQIPLNCTYVDAEDFGTFNLNFIDSNFSILHINARSLPRNFDSIINFMNCINNYKFTVIAITETWLYQNDYASLYDIPGYNFCCSGRRTGRGGGVGLYVSSDIEFNIIENLQDSNNFESLFVEIKNKFRSSIITGVLYRPPGGDIDAFVDDLGHLIDTLNLPRKVCFISGDFNINLLGSNMHIDNFRNMLYSFSFYPMISKPTRVSDHSETLIDNIFSNTKQTTSSHIFRVDISDHYPVAIISENIRYDRKNRNDIYKRDTRASHLMNMRAELRVTSWNDIMSDNNVHSAYTHFHNKLIDIFDRHCPIRRVKTKMNLDKSPWITPGVLKSIKKKNVLFCAYKRNPNDHNLNKYRNYKNILTTVVRQAKSSYYSDYFTANKNNSKKMWSGINSVLNRKGTKNRDLSDNCSNNCQDYVNRFNDYFTTIGEKLASKIDDTNKSPNSYLTSVNIPNTFILRPTDCDEVTSIVLVLDDYKSPGYDELTNEVIKYVHDYIIDPLTYIINLSFNMGEVPDNIKIAKVIPIHKSGQKDVVSNYRPVSVLPAFSKIFERLVYKRMTSFISINNILYSNQYGFRENHSTYMAALKFVDDVSFNLDKKISTVSLFIDLSKAFDTIDHSILLNKLYIYGIRGIAFNWFKSYLTNRKQFVRFNDTDSTLSNINTGVPQGSILGPLLFILYINDMYKSSNMLNFILFADDTTIYLHNNDVNLAIQSMSSELNNVSEWLSANKLSLNIDKTKLLVFTNIKGEIPNYILQFKDKVIESSRTTKFLGLIIDNKLSWRDHITKVSGSISKMVGIMCKIKYYLPSYILLTIYNSLVLPHLMYSIIVWGNALPTYTYCLNILQKRAIRQIGKASYRAHTPPLFYCNNVLTLHDLYNYQLGIFIYNYLNSQLPPDFDSFFDLNRQFHTYSTRGSHDLAQPYTRTTFAHSQVRSTGVIFWNSLNISIRNSPSIMIFKKKLKRYLLLCYK